MQTRLSKKILSCVSLKLKLSNVLSSLLAIKLSGVRSPAMGCANVANPILLVSFNIIILLHEMLQSSGTMTAESEKMY